MRKELAFAKGLNGIDFVEVLDSELIGSADEFRQRLLLVRCLRPLTGASLSVDVEIQNQPRALPVRVQWASSATALPAAGTTAAPAQKERDLIRALPDKEHWIAVRTDRSGDHSPYTLRLNAAGASSAPPAGFDDQLIAETLWFKVECPTEIDCGPAPRFEAPPRAPLDIDYLARDYASFRRLMLDRLSETVPQWTGRNPADIGVTLVELLAYVADHMSYEQDAIATEAYLATARRRVSVRRHATLLDYPMHDGCNARVWVQFLLNADVNGLLPAGTAIVTGRAEETFETLHDVDRLYVSHERMPLHAWGNRDAVLPRGATAAALADGFPNLRAGDTLILEETGGDMSRRHAVRLTRAAVSADAVFNTPVTLIEWSQADALPFTIRLSTSGGESTAIASGNIALADHGRTIDAEPLPPVPAGRFRPFLEDIGITQASRATTQPIDQPTQAVVSARDAFAWDMEDVEADVQLHVAQGEPWVACRTLLSSLPLTREFVLEVEDDGRAAIRFGDGRAGLRPAAGTILTPRYRIGNGSRGNIGAEALRRLAVPVAGIAAVRNPLPARGGVDPESIDSVKDAAPYAFRGLERAVTEQDYVTLAERRPGVQRASARLRWTGSWHTMFLATDAYDEVIGSSEELATRVAGEMERYRLAGYDVAVEPPRYVPLEIEMFVCVKPGYFRHEVRTALEAIFTNQLRPDGRPGLFHPDLFTFGQPVHLSPMYAAAQALPGVDSVRFDVFRRLGRANTESRDTGILTIGNLEVPRLENDPARPPFGLFHLSMGGGR